MYVSTVISTPNEAFHDVMLETDGWEDAYIDSDDLTNPDTADTVYIAIESKDSTSTVQLSAETGDISTGMFMMNAQHDSSTPILITRIKVYIAIYTPNLGPQ